MTSDLNGVGTGPFSTATFTPANDSLQVIAVYASAQSDATFQGSHLTLSNSGGLTCTATLTSLAPPAGTWGHGFRVWTCPVTTGSAMTFTADAGAYDIHQYVIERFQFTGHDTSSPVGATALATNACAGPGTDCPVTINLSGAPAASSHVLAFTSINGGCNSGPGCNPAPGSGWTEIHDLVNTAESWGEYQSQVRTGSTSTSVSWADLNSGNSSPDGAVLGAIEIRAGAGGGEGGALTRTDFAVTSDLNGVGTGPFSTATFTPANSSLQVVAVYASAQSDETFQGSNLTLSNSGGLTCTVSLTSPDPPANTWGHGFRVWTCPVTTGSAMTFTADAGAYDIHQYVIERFQFTGHDTSSPVGATVVATDTCAGPGTDCPVTIALSAAPAASSHVLAFTSINGGCNSGPGCNPAPGSGWIEIHDLVNTSESWGEYQSQVRTGSTSTSVSWADLNSGNSSPDGAVLGAIEIRAGGSGGGGGGPLTRTDFAIASDLNGVGTVPFSTPTFTPANNSLQVVTIYASAASDETLQGSNLILSDSAGLNCTVRLTSLDPPASTWGHGFRVWTCPVTAGIPMTFSAYAGGYNIHQYVIERFEFTGHDTSTPTGATATGTSPCSGNGVNCPATITLSAAPAASSQVLAFTSVNGGCGGTFSGCAPSPASGWTEIHYVVDTSQSWGAYQSQVRAGSTSTGVSWSNLNNGNANPDGAVLGAIEIRATTGGGGDTVPPTITVTSPANNVYTNNASTVITGTVSEPAALTINGQPVATPNNTFSYTTSLQQGANVFTLSATDAASNNTQQNLTINLDTAPPAAPNSASISVSSPSGGQVSVVGQPGAVEANRQVRIRNLVTGAIVVVTAASNGSFSAAIGAASGDTLQVQVIDAAGNVSQAAYFGLGVTTAGALPGAFRVTDQGAATYSMPIETPAGTGGLQPNLALVYDHTAGPGLAGMRWTLGGLSAITRCPTTYAQDGSVAPVRNTSTDRFCLDGNRLVTTGTYGNSGTEYKTEMETFQRIVQLGTQGGGPSSFRVDHPNGLMSFYGTTEDSRVGTAGNVVRAWYLAYREDQFGNRIQYTYAENASIGETVPVEVAWTQRTGSSPKYKLAITYETRPAADQRSGHDAGGAPWAKTKRIDKIDITYNSALIRSYDLTYEAAESPGVGTGRSQLQQVQVCGPTECLAPTVFDTQNGTSGWGSAVSTYASGAGALVGDINGDGIGDLFVPNGSNWNANFGNAAGSFASAQATGATGTNPAARVIDYDVDGRADLLYQSSPNWRILRWTGSAFASIDTQISVASSNNVIAVDFDGDGRQDWLYSDGTTLHWRRNLGGSFDAAQSLGIHVPDVTTYFASNEGTLDFNGDGRADLLVRWRDCLYHPELPDAPCQLTWKSSVYIAQGSSYEHIFERIDDIPAGSFKFGDINGDGLDDLAFYNASSGWVTGLSTGTGIASWTPTGVTGTTVVIADYDNDGRADLIRAAGDHWFVHRSNGATWSSTHTEAIASAGVGSVGGFAADVTGDGFADLLRLSGQNWLTHKHQTALPDVVTAAANGLGATTSVTYAPLTDANIYTKNNSGSPPAYVHVFHGPRYVVASETHDNGIGGVRQFDHKYDTAYVDVAGRGWLSFYSHRVDEIRSGTPTPPPGRRSTRTFDRTFPNAGLVTSEVVRLNTDPIELIATTTNTLSTVEQATLGDPTRYFPRIEESTTEDYSLSGTALRTIVNNPTFENSSGAIATVTKEVRQTVPTAQTWTSVTTFNPTNLITATEYCLGLPGLVTTTNTLPDLTTASRNVRHTFYSTTCALNQVTDESSSTAAKQLRTTYQYDAFGNVDIVDRRDAASSEPLRQTDFSYDSDGQFPTSVDTGSGRLIASFQWNYLHGERAQVTASDGLTTSFQYDDFGRLKRETRPGGGYTDYAYENCSFCWPQQARMAVRETSSDGHSGYRFFDKLLRPVGASWTLPQGTTGREETRYDAWGRVDRVSSPYVAYDPVYWTTYQHDNLDRVTLENAPLSEGQPSGATTGYQYVGRNVTVTDARNNLTTYENNALGQIAKVTDDLGGIMAYAYKPFGELGTVVDAEGRTTTINYDPRGYKSDMTDPNMGYWVYDYNAFGELAHQRSPITASPNWTVSFVYDPAGRVDTRMDRDGSTNTTTSYTYYAASATVGWRGKVDTISMPNSMPNHIEKYEYHATYGAPTLLRRTLEGTAYDFNMTYDAEGRLDLLTYPTSTTGYRFAVDYDYDSFGHMSSVRESGGSGTTFYTLTEADALGREVNLSLGNGLTEYRSFDRASGHLMNIETGPSLSASIQDLELTYDEVGNVESRTNNLIGKTEAFIHDGLNRMESAQVNGLTAVSVAYSASGRITSKSDYGGTYTYGSSAHPYAVTSAGGQSYAYDAAGRMTTHGADTFTWYPYDLPKSLAAGTKSAEFSYGVGRDRYKQVQKTGSTTDATIYYVGTLFEKEVAATTSYRHYVSARGRTVAQVSRAGTTNTVQYLHRDHQGSVVEVTGSTGALVQSLAFDAWGLRRNASTWAALGTPFTGTQPTERGYTGHEHLDSVELIHMNGRVQDPRLGRFLSPDPLVQAPYQSQSLNRYSYVWNNPVSLIDPSGFVSDCYGEDWIDSECQGAPLPQSVPPGWLENRPYAPDPSTVPRGTHVDEPVWPVPQGAQPIGPGGANSVIPEVREHLWEQRQREIKAIDPHASCSGEMCMYTENFGLVFESPKGTTSIGVGPGGIGRAAAVRAIKPLNLPAWRSVSIDIAHVAERHTAAGALSAGRTTFPELMNAKGIERTIREAYRYGEKVATQGERTLVRGQSGGLTIEMWVNRASEAIETAYPIVR